MSTPIDFGRDICLPQNGCIRVVIDTDTYNEVDDQFALAHALLSPDRISVEAVYAAPFVNRRSASPGEGMEKSLGEIHRMISLIGAGPRDGVFSGSKEWLGNPGVPVASPAARDLIERAHSGPGILCVIAIAAPTNIASALLLDPTLADKIMVVWLGGHALHWPHTREFNLEQDLVSSRVLLDSRVPLVLLPCMGVVQSLATTLPELEYHLAAGGELARALLKSVSDFPDKPSDSRFWHKVLWDVAATAWAINSAWCPSDWRLSPEVSDDLHWQTSSGLCSNRKSIRYVYEVQRDPIFEDLFTKILQARQP